MTLAKKVKARTDRLEALFQRYPDVPKEVILKEDLQREGFRFTQAALEHGGRQRRRLKTYHLFSWDQSPLGEMPQGATMQVPDYIYVQGGLYGVKRIKMRPRMHVTSPYLVDLIDGKLWITADGAPILEILTYEPEPKYFEKVFPDGTPYAEVVPPEGYVIVFRQCQHWGPDEECKFCDINENARTKKLLGQVASIQPKKPEQVAAVMEEIFLHEEWPLERRPIGILINGGSITRSLRGLDEDEFYLQYVRAIKERIGNRWPITLHMQPKPKEREHYLRSQGVNARHSNFEVWDKHLFEIICPGKDRVIGRDEWIRRVVDQVEVYGEGSVIPGFVAGVEMAQPWGFKTVTEAIKSTLEGMEFLMSHGAVLRPISWCVEALSALAGQEPPPVEYFIEIDRAWYELWVKYRLPAPTGSVIGTGRNEYANSGAWDMVPW